MTQSLQTMQRDFGALDGAIRRTDPAPSAEDPQSRSVL
jgi:hypothetical protein